ncbi:MAG TPA: TonB-dependent receptor [Chitinophagaceae bacterium]|nr:TonB-dependent receptor [Chitinophagaceae bacterium]
MLHRLRTYFIICFLGVFSQVNGQTQKLTGRVLNEKNDPIAGVTVQIPGSQTGDITDQEGRFSISLSTGKKHELSFSIIGYKTKVVDEIEVKAGELNELNIVLEIDVKSSGGVVVTGKTGAKRETVNAAISFQKNTNTVAQVVSAEMIRRSPDKNTGEVLKRVSGTAVQEGKYLVVRGLSDRYNQAMVNGILLSSTEPDRKTFSFDIFPSAVIDNITINKAFVPEFPGEWAGGLVQVNTKDIPSQDFFNIQIGTGFNTNVIGNKFYKYKGGSIDWLGYDDGSRSLPDGFPTKTKFSALSPNEKTALAATFPNNWAISSASADPNLSVQLGGGFTGLLFKKKFGGTLALTYNRGIKHYKFQNSFYSINNNLPSPDFLYNTDKYAEEILAGAMANFTMQLNNNNKISFKNLFNVNASDYVSLRTGHEFLSVDAPVKAKELAMKTNTFFNTQLSGEHRFNAVNMKMNWYGSFNILDQYVPQQRRSEYLLNESTGLYEARISTGQSQKSGSIFYGNLSDYIYTAGADLQYNFKMSGRQQSVKGGYFFQVKDRLYDARPFYVQLYDNGLKTLPEEQLFAPSNFVPGKLGFDEFAGSQYRYIANSINNSVYLQFDNMFSDKLRVVWGLRVEDFDQLVGSVKQSDDRFSHTRIRDYLPALNITFKLTPLTNLRLSGSQTVVRPEFRELTAVTFYDFELGAAVIGNKELKRTKITNADLRYEIYPRPGELFTFGVFYKFFKNPIEQNFNQSGAGSSNTFNFTNADKATGYGAEFEMRKKLDFSEGLKNFTFSSNLTYIHNRVNFSNKSLDRPMQGQSPFMINAGLQYDIEKHGINTTLLFNEIGRRILYVGNEQVPAIWEASRPLLDFQFAKKIMKNKGELKLNVSDILNTTAKFYHDLDENKKYRTAGDALAIARKYGTTFSITFGYNFK